jgi:hypothetical protein
MADLLETITQSLLSQLVEIPIIRSQQDGPRPKLPYATYQINSRVTVGSDHYGWVDGGGLMPIKGTREGTILVNFYGEEARENADNLVNTLRKVTSHYLMRRLKLVIASSSAVVDMTPLRDSAHFEPMANLDLTFRYTADYFDDVGIIEQVNASGNVDKIEINQIIKGH